MTNPREAHRLVHSLKSSVANLGFSKVADAARGLEARLSSGETISSDDEDVRNLVEIVQSTIVSIGIASRAADEDS